MKKIAKSPIVDIVVVGDAHDSPNLNKQRFKWIGRYLTDKTPDMLGLIGDFITLDSLGKHHAVGSKDDFVRSSFKDDLQSGKKALQTLHSEFPANTIPQHIFLGNHEARAHRQANLYPRECGHFGEAVEDLFQSYRYNVHQYGQIVLIEGVGFVHVPFNAMGKPYSGKTMENNIARDSTCSMVVGHTHKFRYYSEPKIGFNNAVTVMNVGTSMPDGHVEHYAGLNVTGWTYGIARLSVCDGKIIEHSMISMQSLERKYG